MRPIVLQGVSGDLIGYYHPPNEQVSPIGDILLAPAFAEEMNRCRSMVTKQAEALASAGMGTLVLDMHGTGDSPGEFHEGDWENWLGDLRCGIDWLRMHGNGCQAIWGVRLGALMAAHLAAQDRGIHQLLLWMPVINGKSYWTQFLRIRIASEMALPDGVKSTQALRQQSADGLVVETSGYKVGSRLAIQLDSLEMPPPEQLINKTISWLEVGASAESTVPRANALLAESWRSKGVPVSISQVVGPQFWVVHERAVAISLIDASSIAVKAWPSPITIPLPKLDHTFEPPKENLTSSVYPVSFPCVDAQLAGIVHRGRSDARIGVVIVVAGGPQYRVGAHRQFVSMARMFASNGYPVMRFDLRGMGDSSGEYLGFEHSGFDVRAAIDEFLRLEPSVQEVGLFGECESASGILFYAGQDPRVGRIALANPWVRTPGVQAEAILKHYYLNRLRSRRFWLSVWSGEFKLGASLASFVKVFTTFMRGRKSTRAKMGKLDADSFDHLPLPSRTAEGLRRFGGKVLLLMSGRDLIAREFDEVTKVSKDWRGLLSSSRITRKDIADADHTFSKPDAKAEAQKALLAWLVDK